MASSPVLFTEIQRFRHVWLFVLVGLITVLAWTTAVIQIGLGRPVGNNPAPDTVVYVVVVLFGIGLPIMLVSARMRVTVTAEKVLVDYFPFMRRSFARRDIRSAEVTTFRPVMEYGGWGIRYNLDGIWAYIVNGNRGVLLTFSDGVRIIIGSRRPQELANSLRAMMSG